MDVGDICRKCLLVVCISVGVCIFDWRWIFLCSDICGGYKFRQVYTIHLKLMFQSLDQISKFRIRGILCSMNQITNGLGHIVGLCASLYFDYLEFAKMAFLLPVIFFILLSLVPDSPSSLRLQKKFVVINSSIKMI